MKTVLLVSDSPESQRLLTEIVGQHTNLVVLPAPVEPTREKFDALFATWLRLVEAVIVDAASLGESSRLAVEALAVAPLQDYQSVVLRATARQQSLLAAPTDWLVVSDQDGYDQLKQSVRNYFELRHARAKLKRTDAVIARQRHVTAAWPASPAPVAPQPSASAQFNLFQYRDALKSISRVLGQHPDERALLSEFFRLVRELLGVGKLAIFLRPIQTDLFHGPGRPMGRQLAIAASAGIATEVVEHLRLTADAGLGGRLAREARILHRARLGDPLALDFDSQTAREFELLGTEVAVPIFDNDQLLGVLTFSGKITGEPLTNEELELVYHLMTHLAQAIRNLHLLNQVAGQQRFMKEVLANIHSGVVVVAQDGRILSCNQRARQLLDLGDRDLPGQAIHRLPARVADVIFEALATGNDVRQREVTLPPTQRPLSVSATRFATNLNAPTSDQSTAVAVGLLDDLTQTRLQEAQARALADKEFFVRLAFRLSHELANSMVSIKTFAQLLPERGAEKDFCEQFSREVLNDVRRMDGLISALSFFAEPLELVFEELDLHELIESCARTLGAEFGRANAPVVVDTGDAPAESVKGFPTVTLRRIFSHRSGKLIGDRIRLIQAVEQLLRNAIQAMPKGGRLTLSTADAPAAEMPDGGVSIEFQDTGVGIPLEDLKNITEPFVAQRNVGVGLGLTVAKKIVEGHGGRLSIDSMLGRGTTVVVVLPLKPPRQPIMPEAGKPLADPERTGTPSPASEPEAGGKPPLKGAETAQKPVVRSRRGP